MAQIPGPRENDLDDVSVSLEVAQRQWGRGDHAEALKWLRKAAEAAFEGGDDRRGIELSKVIADASAEARAAKDKGRTSSSAVAPALPVQHAVATIPAVPKVVPNAAKAGSFPSTGAAAPSVFGPPRPATFPPPPLAARSDVSSHIVDAAADASKKAPLSSGKRTQSAKGAEPKSVGLRASQDAAAKKGPTHPVISAASGRKSQSGVRSTATSAKPIDSLRKSSKPELKSSHFDDDSEEATHEWSMPLSADKLPGARDSSVNMTVAADEWTTIDEPIELVTSELPIVPALETIIVSKPEPKITAKPETRQQAEVREAAGTKKRARDATSSDPLVSRPFTQAVRVAVSRNASGVIVARLLDLAGQLREGEVEAMLVGMRAGELEELFR